MSSRHHPAVARLLRLAACTLAGLAAALMTGCATAPFTQRAQLNLIPDQQMSSMAATQYKDVVASAKLSSNQAYVQQVRQVGARIAAATEDFCQHNSINMTFNWEFNVIHDDTQVNAWCMPGGKIAFYSAIMPLCQTDAGVAVVMGHEVAHALARHGSERLSQTLLANLGMVAFAEALKSKPDQTRQLWLAAVGAGLQYGVQLPFSRQQELEADRIGLILMAKAGYDPHYAIEFWTRMSSSGGNKPPELLSTHPSDTHRIEQIRKYLPEALTYYHPM